jgi:hypothetical protein
MDTEASFSENILTKKCEYLESILIRTQNFLNQYQEDPADVEGIKNFLDERGNLIDSIQELDDIEVESDNFLDEKNRISTLARKIVEIDKKFYNLLSEKKKKMIKDIKKVTDNINKRSVVLFNQEGKTKLVDIEG